jgi:amino acid permease
MVRDFFKHYLYPIATLSGGAIGVGFLSLPYIALQAGIWLTLFYFAAITILVITINVIFGSISLKTPDHKRFPGFVGFYLGHFAKIATLCLMILGTFGVLLVYLIVGSQFLTTIASPFFGGNAIEYVMLYAFIGSLLTYFGIKIISRVELWSIGILLVAFFIIFVQGFSHIRLENLFISNVSLGGLFGFSKSQISNLLLPYGAIMFALWGNGLIPETEEMLVGRKHTLRRIIIISTLVPALIYLVFIFLILSLTGQQTSESALMGLTGILGSQASLVALLVGLIATFVAFISQGIFLKKIFMYDMGIKEPLAWAIVAGVPLLLFLAGFNSFIPLISFIGGFLLPIEGILILLMYKKIGGKKIVIYPLFFVFILGIVYEIFYFVR